MKYNYHNSFTEFEINIKQIQLLLSGSKNAAKTLQILFTFLTITASAIRFSGSCLVLRPMLLCLNLFFRCLKLNGKII